MMKKHISESFVRSNLSYCGVIWHFWNIKWNGRKNVLHTLFIMTFTSHIEENVNYGVQKVFL